MTGPVPVPGTETCQDDTERLATLEQQVTKLAVALGTLCVHISDDVGEWRVRAALRVADEIAEARLREVSS